MKEFCNLTKFEWSVFTLPLNIIKMLISPPYPGGSGGGTGFQLTSALNAALSNLFYLVFHILSAPLHHQ
jgi:hypothetical protein